MLNGDKNRNEGYIMEIKIKKLHNEFEAKENRER